MSYKGLEIWKLADELVVEIHEMTLTRLPKFEMFEEGTQIRNQVSPSSQISWKDMGERDTKQSL